MNERIREVWIKAAREDSDPDNWDTQVQFIERFAELIVRECINGIANDTANYQGVGMMSYYQGVQDALKSIHKHFGVE